MAFDGWLRRDLIFPRLGVDSVNGLLERLTPAMTAATNCQLASVEVALWRAISDNGNSLGLGVVIPRAELTGLDRPVVALVVLAQPLGLPSIDGRAPDLIFCILSPPDAPHDHLMLLAHIARLAKSRVLLGDLRAATDADAVMRAVAAAEGRLPPVGPTSSTPVQNALVTIVLEGEAAVDALLVDLVAMGIKDGTIVEGQSLRQAVTREVPLFSGFRDLFGDPGGRRVVMLQTELPRVEAIVAAVKQVCDTHDVRKALVDALPLTSRWAHRREPEPPPEVTE